MGQIYRKVRKSGKTESPKGRKANWPAFALYLFLSHLFMNDNFLLKKLNERKQHNAFRQLLLPDGKTDFCSNDYLGIVHNKCIEQQLAMLQLYDQYAHGSTGSRLLAGNY